LTLKSGVKSPENPDGLPVGTLALNLIDLGDRIVIIGRATREDLKDGHLDIPIGIIDKEPWSDPIFKEELKSIIEGWITRKVVQHGGKVVVDRVKEDAN
jgi:hypothetical protein